MRRVSRVLLGAAILLGGCGSGSVSSGGDAMDFLCTESRQCENDSLKCDRISGRCVLKQEPAHCGNGELDAGEADVDCGGECLASCGNRQGCEQDGDCRSLYCDTGTMKCGRRPCGQDGDCPMGSCDSGWCSTCLDGRKNGAESDIDCGGACLSKCDLGRGCAADGDCKSGVCVNGACARDGGCTGGDDCASGECDLATGRCVIRGNPVEEDRCAGVACGADRRCDSETGACVEIPASCHDGVKNGGETDVDCGGSCGAACEVGRGCAQGRDCESNVCEGGVCAANPCASAQPGEVVINEVMSNPDPEKPMEHSGSNQMKFIELYNPTDAALRLDNLVVEAGGARMGVSSGCIAGKQFVLYSAAAIEGLTAMTPETANFVLPAVSSLEAGAFEMKLMRGGSAIHRVSVPDMSGRAGVSAGLPENAVQLESGAWVLVPSTEIATEEGGIAGAACSPGVPNSTGKTSG